MTESTGRVAVITGGASGMGLAFAEHLAAKGVTVVAADMSQGFAHEPAVSGIELVQCDVSDPEQVQALADKVHGAHGRVDILVNAAGIFPQANFEDTSLELWNRVLAINLSAMFLTCQAFIPGMASRSFGRVINFSSRTFFIPSVGYSAYIAAKAGVIGLTRALATEYGPHGVTANVIAPGLIRSEGVAATVEPERFELLAQRQPVNRVGTPQDAVAAIAFFAGDDAGFITGQTLVVDGGLIRL
jgi:3-oxoacyl-[acyl-carrier protein] reductase/(S)-1-phenylethanol dehydrogenase